MNKLKVFLYLVVVVITMVIGFYAIIVVSFIGGGKFYIPFILVGGILFLILLLLQMFRLVKNKKKMRTAWLVFAGLLIISCSAYEGKKAYDKNIPRVGEGNVNLELYKPFQEGTKAVALNKPSTLKIEDNLPRLNGATAFYPLYSAFVQAVYPPKDYNLYNSEVACSKTIRAYQSLIDKDADVIFVGFPSKEQSDMAKNADVELKLTPIGKEAFVFFVNAHNPVENLTVEQLQGIYSGKIKNWKEVGGQDEKIRPFQRNENSGSQTAFLRFMEGHEIVQPELEDVIGEMGGIISQTADYANYRNAIGFSFRFYAQGMVNNDEIRLLKINGVSPELETIRNGTYPLASSFYAATLTENDHPHVPEFLQWILSDQGQYLIEKTGYCPLK